MGRLLSISKLNKIILVCLAALLSYVSLNAQKKVYWIHGYNDNHEVWQRYRSILTDSSHRGAEIDWYASDSLTVSAQDVASTISSPAILIGHSAGGLVARKAVEYNSRIRAIITAGSPNKGAGIVSSVKNKSYRNIIGEASLKIQSCVSSSLAALASIIFPATSISSVIEPLRILVLSMIDIGVNCWISQKLNDIEDDYTSDPSFQDMDPKGPFITGLNDNPNTVPIVSIYGAEDKWPLIRMWGSGENLDSLQSMTNTADNGYDTSKMGVWNGCISTCKYMEWGHGILGVGLAALSFWYPRFLSPAAYNATTALSWSNLARYLEYDIHNEYSEIIGAMHYETKTYTTGILWWKKKHTKTVPVYESHDGLIANKHSMMDSSGGAYVKNVEVKGVNHLEMGANATVRSLLNTILSGNNNEYPKTFSPKYY